MPGASLSASSWGHFALIPRDVGFPSLSSEWCHHTEPPPQFTLMCHMKCHCALMGKGSFLCEGSWILWAEISELVPCFIYIPVLCSSCSPRKPTSFLVSWNPPGQPGRLLYCWNYPFFTYGCLNCCYPWLGVFFSLLRGLRLTSCWMALVSIKGRCIYGQNKCSLAQAVNQWHWEHVWAQCAWFCQGLSETLGLRLIDIHYP